jgi:hypothetical protein
MKPIPTRFHGLLDYLVGVVLILSPWLFHFNYHGPETWLPIILGAAALVYSLLTRYELGIVKAIPMPTHLALDMVSGIILALSPWLFGFSNLVWAPHLILGMVKVGAALLTQRQPEWEIVQFPGR